MNSRYPGDGLYQVILGCSQLQGSSPVLAPAGIQRDMTFSYLQAQLLGRYNVQDTAQIISCFRRRMMNLLRKGKDTAAQFRRDPVLCGKFRLVN
jgi:hypothetical protein